MGPAAVLHSQHAPAPDPAKPCQAHLHACGALAAGLPVAAQPRQVEQQEGEGGGRLGLEAGGAGDVTGVGRCQVMHDHLQESKNMRKKLKLASLPTSL